jgi:hypothetical protein
MPVRMSADLFRGLSRSAWFLVAVWSVFLLLVIFGIHGSSTAVTAEWWSPEKPYSGYLLSEPHSSGLYEPQTRDPRMGQPRWIRWDELTIATPLALAQLSHKPRFPVINTNIGDGQNMLVAPHWPVLHVLTLARPATWGYFLLGAQRGLAWHWWFQVFGCFTVLYLLLDVILKGRKGLAAFGAFWFCGSAYVVCWSLWPAQLTFFGALSCLAAYHLLKSEKLPVQLLSALLFGLGLAGFVMFIYPPWQVSLAYLFLMIFGGLFVRDKLYLSFRPITQARLFCVAGAVLVACGMIGWFVLICWSDFQLMSETVYPGRRVSLGGDYPFALIFKGLYNYYTIYDGSLPQPLLNQSESASFYYLFPAVLVALVLSNRFRKAFDIVGWLLAVFMLLMLVFFLAGVPESVATTTLMSYVTPRRGEVALGLASILLCTYALSLSKSLNQGAQSRWTKVMPWAAGTVVTLLFVLHGSAFTAAVGQYRTVNVVLAFSTIGGLLSGFLLSGWSKPFYVLMGIVIVLTTATFNPLCTNLDHIYKSEVAEQIVRLNNEATDRPLWLSYGSVHPGILVTALGGRSLAGVHWPPQLSLWKELDPVGGYLPVYNRYAHFQLTFEPNELRIAFDKTGEDSYNVRISPNNAIVTSRGARYVLAMGNVQAQVKASNFVPVYKSPRGTFTIYEIGPKAPP